MKRNNFNIGGLIVLIILLLFPAVFLVPVFFDSKMDSDVKILWSILALIIISVEIIGLIRNKNKITSTDNLNKSSNTNIVPNESKLEDYVYNHLSSDTNIVPDESELENYVYNRLISNKKIDAEKTKVKAYAQNNQLVFNEDKTDFFEYELPFESFDVYDFFSVFEGNKEDLNYWFGLCELKVKDKNVNKSLLIIKNKHLGLPRFYVRRNGDSSNRYKVDLEYEKRFIVVGRPSKVVKQVFTYQVNEFLNRIFESFKGIEKIEVADEYMCVQCLPSFNQEEFAGFKDMILAFSSILAQNEEFNVDHIY